MDDYWCLCFCMFAFCRFDNSNIWLILITTNFEHIYDFYKSSLKLYVPDNKELQAKFITRNCSFWPPNYPLYKWCSFSRGKVEMPLFGVLFLFLSTFSTKYALITPADSYCFFVFVFYLVIKIFYYFRNGENFKGHHCCVHQPVLFSIIVKLLHAYNG